MDFTKKAVKNKILEIRVGSHLFGTNTPDSDLDLYGLFMPFDEIVYGSYKCEQVSFDQTDKDSTGRNTKDAVDFTLCEYRKYIHLALQNNPNILNSLFVDNTNIRFINEFGERLLEKAELFPHKGCHHRFIKYAHSQKHKMQIKVENWQDLRKGLEILENSDQYQVMSDFKDIPPFTYPGKGKHIKLGDLHFELGIFNHRAKRMIKERLSKATNRTELFTKFGFDVKYGGNLIQLMKEGIELLNTGRIEFPLSFRQDILDIKMGNYTCDEIIKWSDQLEDEARIAFEKTKLPTKPRTKEIEQFAMTEIKRYLTQL